MARVYRIGRQVKHRQDWLTIGLVVTMPIWIVTSLHCHNYDLLLLVPGLACVVGYHLYRGMPRWPNLAASIAVLVMIMPIYNKIHYDYLLKGGLINPFVIKLIVMTFWSLQYVRKEQRGA